MTAIYLALQLLAGSSRLLEAVGQTFCFSTALLRDRVYIVKPMLPWAGWALTPPFHPYVVDSRIQIARFTASGKVHTVCGISSPHRTRLRWASMGAPFGGYAVYLCCTCPEVTLGGRYPLSLPCGARTFLIWGLSATIRGCPTWSLKYCTASALKSQMSCKIFLKRIYYN